MLRTVLLLLLVIVAFLVLLIFSWLNPELIEVDIALAEITLRKSQAFAASLVIGWLFGMASMLIIILKLMNDKRRLRKAVRDAEAQVQNLQSLPMSDPAG